MPDKLTDKEIVKALECAIRNDCDCNCVFLLPNKVQDVLDLINRLQAENERLKTQLYLEKYTDVAKKKIKAEAYKEFAERLIPMIDDGYVADIIDNLLKELKGND